MRVSPNFKTKNGMVHVRITKQEGKPIKIESLYFKCKEVDCDNCIAREFCKRVKTALEMND